MAEAAVQAPVTRPVVRTRMRRRRSPLGVTGRYAVLVGIALVYVFPFVVSLANSFKTDQDAANNPVSLIPKTFTTAAYQRLFQSDLPLWLTNTVIVTVLVTAGRVLFDSMAGYALSRLPFRGRNAVFAGLVAVMAVPGVVLLIPKFLGKYTGFLGTWVPLFGMNLFGSAFYIFLQRQFFLGLPRELFEAARIDGASYWGLFWRIAMPLSIPSFIIIFLFEFQASWNNLQAALIYLNAGQVSQFTAPLGIAYAMTRYSPTNGGQGDYQFVMVAALLVTLPMLALFAFGQRYFIEGVATQGRKG